MQVDSYPLEEKAAFPGGWAVYRQSTAPAGRPHSRGIKNDHPLMFPIKYHATEWTDQCEMPDDSILDNILL